MNEKIIALIYDFDKTLSPKDMQEYAFIPELDMESKDFWAKCNEKMRLNNMDQILAYMRVMIEESHGKAIVTQKKFFEQGKNVELFKGVPDWFKRVNDYAAKLGFKIEHYIISSGIKSIIEGTSIAGEFKEIYAAEFCYDDGGVPYWPALAVNYTSKTQFLFRINKGILNVIENEKLNEYMPENERRIPFKNMIYVGDGLTDIPSMKVVKSSGGHSIAVYQGDKKAEVNRMVLQERVDFVVEADYSQNSTMENRVFAIVDKIAADDNIIVLHNKDIEIAKEEKEEKQKEKWIRGDTEVAVENYADNASVVPKCPTCKADMVLRTVKKGGKVGTKFWGCSEFPNCRGSLPYNSDN